MFGLLRAIWDSTRPHAADALRARGESREDVERTLRGQKREHETDSCHEVVPDRSLPSPGGEGGEGGKDAFYEGYGVMMWGLWGR